MCMSNLSEQLSNCPECGHEDFAIEVIACAEDLDCITCPICGYILEK